MAERYGRNLKIQSIPSQVKYKCPRGRDMPLQKCSHGNSLSARTAELMIGRGGTSLDDSEDVQMFPYCPKDTAGVHGDDLGEDAAVGPDHQNICPKRSQNLGGVSGLQLGTQLLKDTQIVINY